MVVVVVGGSVVVVDGGSVVVVESGDEVVVVEPFDPVVVVDPERTVLPVPLGRLPARPETSPGRSYGQLLSPWVAFAMNLPQMGAA